MWLWFSGSMKVVSEGDYCSRLLVRLLTSDKIGADYIRWKKLPLCKVVMVMLHRMHSHSCHCNVKQHRHNCHGDVTHDSHNYTVAMVMLNNLQTHNCHVDDEQHTHSCHGDVTLHTHTQLSWWCWPTYTHTVVMDDIKLNIHTQLPLWCWTVYTYTVVMVMLNSIHAHSCHGDIKLNMHTQLPCWCWTVCTHSCHGDVEQYTHGWYGDFIENRCTWNWFIIKPAGLIRRCGFCGSSIMIFCVFYFRFTKGHHRFNVSSSQEKSWAESNKAAKAISNSVTNSKPTRAIITNLMWRESLYITYTRLQYISSFHSICQHDHLLLFTEINNLFKWPFYPAFLIF